MLIDLNYKQNVKYIRFIYEIVRKWKKIIRIKNMFKREKEKKGKQEMTHESSTGNVCRLLQKWPIRNH